MTTKAERLAQLAQEAANYGLNARELTVLLRAERALQRWAEKECGDSDAYASYSIERDPETDQPYWCVYWHTGPVTRRLIPDREAQARRQVERVLATHPDLVALYNGDPRGAVLRITTKAQLAQDGPHTISRSLVIGV